MKPQAFIDRLNSGEFDSVLKKLYGESQLEIEKAIFSTSATASDSR